jgi:lysylphosphatidylglycerol synthetase-like protein (DUF2156 family)
MGMFGFVITLVLLLLNVFGTVRLQKSLHTHLTLELVFLVAALFFWLVTILALAGNKRWAWSLNTVLFSLSTANLLWIYSQSNGGLTLFATLAVNAFAVILGILAIDLYQPDFVEPVEPLETYEAEEKKSKKEKSSKKSKSKKSDNSADLTAGEEVEIETV